MPLKGHANPQVIVHPPLRRHLQTKEVQAISKQIAKSPEDIIDFPSLRHDQATFK
jgi:hypothetical protein